jgi:cytochrome P450
MSKGFKTQLATPGTMTAMTKSWNDLPGPPTPWWGLPKLAAMRRDYLGTIAAQQAYGDLPRLGILNERTVDVFDPELLRELMVDHAGALIRWERGTEVFAEGLGQSVLVTEGAVWQRQRRMLTQAFTPKKVAGYAGLMLEATDHGLAGVQPGEVAMDALLSHLAMDVISRTLFGQPISGDTRSAAAAVQVLSETALAEMFWPMTLPDWLPLPGKAAKRRAYRLISGLIRARIDDHTRATGSTSMLGMLRAVRDEATGQALSEQEVFDQCILSFQAGHETTATALCWWADLMARHPQAQARAVDELDAVLAGQAPAIDAPQALPWLSATLKEAMRLYPPAGALLSRRLTREVMLGGVRLPARTIVRITPWVLHRDPRWWPDATSFAPERFLPDAPPPPRGAYLPFGVGPRVCLGQHFATLEMTLIAARLLQRFRLSPCTTEPPRPKLAVTLRPQGGVRLCMEARP